ncbi:MAG TPA: ABC transporter substrate-binding protein [Roseomonas sp.]|jgi:ABC transporter substrate binding protein (PQQ-dependent alcohol dehydrogenase system)
MLLIAGLCLLLARPIAPSAYAQESVAMAFLGHRREPTRSTSPLDEPAPDLGLAGAKLGVAENATSGRFIGQSFTLDVHMVGPDDDPAPIIGALAGQGIHFVVADLPAGTLKLAGRAAAKANITIVNVNSPDDSLRNAECQLNVLHTIPSRAMLADGLAQYLVWKRWPRWFLLIGRHPGDRLYAEAVRRAASRFGAEIVVEKEWSFQHGHGRADTGHVALQTEIPAATRVRDYDVLVVADEKNEFGDYLDGRTARPRPIAGTHGLVATGWSAVNDQWGAAQLQRRFRSMAGRRMTAVDFAAWLAVRSIGEAALHLRSVEPEQILERWRDPEFLVGGFKGQGLSFRTWDGQMRQPILIAGPRMLVSVSPQSGFLHQVTPLDSLGFDRPETGCRAR